MQAEILTELSKLKIGMFWSNPTGAGKSLDGEWIRYGLKGSSDILGVVLGGYFVAIEVKTGSATQSPQQIKFEDNIKKWGGHYCVARCVEDAICFVKSVAAQASAR